jgi:hypothetical protein
MREELHYFLLYTDLSFLSFLLQEVIKMHRGEDKKRHLYGVSGMPMTNTAWKKGCSLVHGAK